MGDVGVNTPTSPKKSGSFFNVTLSNYSDTLRDKDEYLYCILGKTISAIVYQNRDRIDTPALKGLVRFALERGTSIPVISREPPQFNQLLKRLGRNLIQATGCPNHR